MKHLSLTLIVLLLTGCGQEPMPLPSGKSDFAGVWQLGEYPAGTLADFEGRYIYLEINPEGNVVYAEFWRSGMTTSCTSIGSSPIKTFTDQQFEVSVMWVITMTYVINAPPHEDNGEWKMSVDGHELTRSDTRNPNGYTFSCDDAGLVRSMTAA